MVVCVDGTMFVKVIVDWWFYKDVEIVGFNDDNEVFALNVRVFRVKVDGNMI